MAQIKLNKKVKDQIEKAVECYKDNIQDYDNLAKRVVADFTNHSEFKDLIHSCKFRIKSPKDLQGKLILMAEKAKKNGKKFNISEKNIFAKIDDLAGIRFLHLHTKQIEFIHPLMLEILDYFEYEIVQEPFACTWDIENKKLFEEVGFKTEFREDMYTSVHYIVTPHYSDDRCEIQVRTLMEELWGEVSHTINYPNETDSIPCKEQLRVLARLASGCTRLVDSIFTTYDCHNNGQ